MRRASRLYTATSCSPQRIHPDRRRTCQAKSRSPGAEVRSVSRADASRRPAPGPLLPIHRNHENASPEQFGAGRTRTRREPRNPHLSGRGAYCSQDGERVTVATLGPVQLVHPHENRKRSIQNAAAAMRSRSVVPRRACTLGNRSLCDRPASPRRVETAKVCRSGRLPP